MAPLLVAHLAPAAIASLVLLATRRPAAAVAVVPFTLALVPFFALPPIAAMVALIISLGVFPRRNPEV